MLEPEDFELPTVVINHVHMVVTDNVRLMLGEKVINPRTGEQRPPVFHYAFVISLETAERVAQNILATLGDHRAKQLANEQGSFSDRLGDTAVVIGTPLEPQPLADDAFAGLTQGKGPPP